MIDCTALQNSITERRDEMVKDLVALCSIPAINPRMNGKGEYKRGMWLKAWLEQNGLPCRMIQVPDDAVEEGVRLNLISVLPGKDTGKTLWFIAHMDTVHTGDLALWNTDPLKPQVMDGRVYGLGCEDNAQAVITCLHVAKVLKENNGVPGCNIGFLFVSDEETGNHYGLRALIDQGDIFGPRDEAIVPDGGRSAGDFIEIAEKSQVWLRFTVNGRQSHAAMPQLGINACSIGMHLGVEVEDMLKRDFGKIDELFEPPYSSFELTQKFANVNSPNVLPGQDCFTMDMRILPEFLIDDIMAAIQKVVARYEQNHPGCTIETAFVTRVQAPKPTDPNTAVTRNLMQALKEIGTEAHCGGIGAATCAAELRKIGLPAIVWSTIDDMAHQPNEYCIIDNLVRDAKVFLSTIAKEAD